MASSIASGRPSNRQQISATADAVSSVSPKSGFTAWARSMNNRIASDWVQLVERGMFEIGPGQRQRGPANTCSPRRCSTSRLVTSSFSWGHSSEQFPDVGGGRGNLLKVIEEQQHRPGPQLSLKLLE